MSLKMKRKIQKRKVRTIPPHAYAHKLCIFLRLSGGGIRRHEGLLPTTKEMFLSATVGFQEDDC